MLGKVVGCELGPKEASMRNTILLPCCILALAVAGSAHGQGSLDGQWVGKTSQETPVSFEIQDGTLKSFTLGYQLPLDEPCSSMFGTPVTVLGGTMTVYFPYTQEAFDLLNSRGTTGIDPSTVGIKVGKAGFAFSRDTNDAEGRKELLNVVATIKPDGSASGRATITATTCKGSRELTWSARKDK
jgi:hypothetical protein